MKITIEAQVQCSHCGDKVVTPFEDEGGHSFCCQGCMSVYQILQQSNLQQFYNIQEKTDDYTRSVKNLKNKEFKYLDNLKFIEKYTHDIEGFLSMSFYLQGVHCLACLWLIEKLPELVENVMHSRLDMGKSLVTITLRKGENSFSAAAKCLNSLGYDPYPISNQTELKENQQKEERSLLLKIGIAAFSMMNIMLYTGSVYAGAKGLFQVGFGYLSLLLAIPVVFYSAIPFYKSAIGAIKNKKVNIDVPLSLSIIFGFIVSSVFVVLQKEEFYFDSIATLTFLILLSRYILKKAQQKSLNKNDLLSIFQRESTYRKIFNTENFEEVLPDQLNPEDIVRVGANEIIPCDGEIIKGTTRINLSTLTGESQSIFHGLKSQVYMGTLNLGDTVEILVNKTNQQTRIGQLLLKIQNEKSERSQYSFITDKVSKYFVSLVLLLATIVFCYYLFKTDLVNSLEHTLALVIVTCPCALGLATPLTFSRIMALAQRNGLIIKSEDAIERLSNIKNIFFDKTGTLTTGNYQVTEFEYFTSRSDQQIILLNILFSLESKSNHPVALSIVKWCSTHNNHLKNLQLINFEVVLGKGVKGFVEDQYYEVSTTDTGKGYVNANLYKNGEKALSLKLSDDIRNDSHITLEKLRGQHFKTFLVSGDKDSVVQKIGKELLFEPGNIHSEVAPEKKSLIIEKYQNSLFVGDGANDSLAFKKADVSIATHGSVEMCLRTSDIFLGEDKLELINYSIVLSKRAMKVIRINLGFSLIYNIIGASLAITGFIGPLEAAIIMPISSLTILGITLYHTRNGVTLGNS